MTLTNVQPPCDRLSSFARINSDQSPDVIIVADAPFWKTVSAEITFDLVMKEEMPFVEGCYRLEGQPWQVFLFRHSRKGMEEVGIKKGLTWGSGVAGLNVILPDDVTINKSRVLQVMADALGVTEWREVHGPDSMALR